MTGDLLRFPSSSTLISAAEASAAAERFLTTSAAERVDHAGELALDQSETLLSLCQLLDQQIESSPAQVARDAEFLYCFLERLPPSRGSFLFDEREYYLGELALLAGCSSRFLSRREEARTWLDRAEAWFLLTANVAGDVARLSYQRLALKIEERQFDEVLKLVIPLTESFTRTRSFELALKCQCLQGVALKESGQLDEAFEVFRKICRDASEAGNDKLLGSAYVNLTQIHADLGRAEEALSTAQEASTVLKRTGSRTDLAKLHVGIAALLRSQGKLSAAMEAYRSAQNEFIELEMRADVAAIHLIVADLSLESGQERQAEWEIRQALPVIDELKMVPEGVAALSLLRESLRRRSIDRQALRDLHGYFDDNTD